MLGFFDLSPDACFHLSVAIREHRKACAKRWVKVPDELRVIEARVSARLTRGPEVSALADPVGPTDAGEVQMWTTEQAARRLACSVSTVKRRIADGELPVVRVGRSVRIRPNDLDAFLDGNADKGVTTC